MQHTVSPTGDLSPSTVAAFRTNRNDLDYTRNADGLPDLTECDRCDDGIVQRVVEDYAPDSGISYNPVNGCSVDYVRVPVRYGSEVPRLRAEWLCPSCAATAGIEGTG